jgi:transcriptional regulator with XRE-family HTH domain
MESVRRMRREKGLSQQELAELAGVGQDSISAIETGKHEPHPRTLRKLAMALDVEVADFFKEPVPLAETPREAGQPTEADLAEAPQGKTVTGAAPLTGSGSLRAAGVVKIDAATLGVIIWRVHQREIGPDEAMEEVSAASEPA